MAEEDRKAIVSVVEETYALLGRALAADMPEALPGARPDILQRLRTAQIDPLVTDAEMLALLQDAYSDLGETVSQLNHELLGPSGDSHDDSLERAQLTGVGREMKVRG